MFPRKKNNETKSRQACWFGEKRIALSVTRTGKLEAWRKFCRSGAAKTRLRLSRLDIHITTMAALPAMRPLGCLRSLVRASEPIQPLISRRFISTAYSKRPERVPLPQNMPPQFLSQIPLRFRPDPGMYPGINFIGQFQLC